MTQPILVTGATGTLGRAVVAQLTGAGHAVRIASRRPAPNKPGPQWATVDYHSGAGLSDAVDNVAAIIHCAGEYRHINVDRRLIDAARGAGGAHLVYISIVGADRIPLGYYRVKLAVERLIEESALPWSILRTTQFHDFIPRLWDPLARLPVVPVPSGVRIQPIDVRDVAARLVDLAVGDPAGRVPDLGGPEIHPIEQAVRAYLTASGRRRAILPVAIPGKTIRAAKAGGNLTPDRADGRISYAQFLADRYAGTVGATP